MDFTSENGSSERETLLSSARFSHASEDILTKMDMRLQRNEDHTKDTTSDEASRLKALSADVRDQDELERKIERQVRLSARLFGRFVLIRI